MATYGPSANGIEGDPARINVMNLNWFTTLSTRMVNEAHFTYSRESRPRTAAGSGLTADTGMGFGPSFRFGDPFFLQPNVDELIWRTQLKDSLSLVTGKHTYQGGRRVDAHAERSGVPRLLHGPLHLQQRVGLSALRVASCGGRVRSEHGRLLQRLVRHVFPAACPAGSTTDGGPLLLYLQGAGRTGLATDAAGASTITERRVLALRTGLLADSSERHPELRAALGRADDARDRRSADDRVRRVPRRPDVPLRRHDSEPVEHVAAARWASPGM